MKWRGESAVLLLAAACAAVPAHAWRTAAAAQQVQVAAPVSPSQGVPALHKRSAVQPDSTTPPVLATGHIGLPPEAEGLYPLSDSGDKLGNAIELDFERGKLQGYMTERIDPNPHTAAVTFDFATTHADGHAVEFATRVVHGTWYSFSGHLERGQAASPSLAGYYLLAGTLTRHNGDAGGSTRTVSLKREPSTQ